MSENDFQESLELKDLLDIGENDVLSEYLTISLSNDGVNSKLTVATTDDASLEYHMPLLGITTEDLHSILNDGLTDLPPTDI